MTQDLMFADDIRESVRAAYAQIPSGGGEPVTRRTYSAAELAGMPTGAVAWALGVGNPVRRADLQPGDTVLDVGSGGGIDTILAANVVGPTGHVIGLDLLEEMCARGRTHAREAGVGSWTEFIGGQMEAIPLGDGVVDMVISNGVLNLSARKSRALAEILRVLRPGGRLCVADLVVDEDLPPQVLGSPSAWAGCISGALSQRVFLRKLRNVGFEETWIGFREPFGLAEAVLYPLFTPNNIQQLHYLLPVERHDRIATAVLVRARKPG